MNTYLSENEDRKNKSDLRSAVSPIVQRHFAEDPIHRVSDINYQPTIIIGANSTRRSPSYHLVHCMVELWISQGRRLNRETILYADYTCFLAVGYSPKHHISWKNSCHGFRSPTAGPDNANSPSLQYKLCYITSLYHHASMWTMYICCVLLIYSSLMTIMMPSCVLSFSNQTKRYLLSPARWQTVYAVWSTSDTVQSVA